VERAGEVDARPGAGDVGGGRAPRQDRRDEGRLRAGAVVEDERRVRIDPGLGQATDGGGALRRTEDHGVELYGVDPQVQQGSAAELRPVQPMHRVRRDRLAEVGEHAPRLAEHAVGEEAPDD
jgi:hypothetical protein